MADWYDEEEPDRNRITTTQLNMESLGENEGLEAGIQLGEKRGFEEGFKSEAKLAQHMGRIIGAARTVVKVKNDLKLNEQLLIVELDIQQYWKTDQERVQKGLQVLKESLKLHGIQLE